MDSSRFVTYLTPDMIELRNNADGCMTVVGAFTLLPGLFAIIVGLAVLLHGIGDTPLWGLLLGLGSALAFTTVATGLLWLRTWMVFDRTAHTLVERRGLLVAWQTKAQEDLTPFFGVRLMFTPAGFDSRESYLITLTGSNGEREVWYSNSDEDAYAVATCLAQFLHLPLQKVTAPNTILKKERR